MSLSPRLSYIKLRNAQDIESIELVIDGNRHHVLKREGGIFSQHFDEPLMFVTEQLFLLVGRKKSRFGFSSQTAFESIPISSADILYALQRNPTSEILARVRKKGHKVSITLGILSITFRVLFPAKPASTNSESLPPKTEDLVKQCPRFRILVIGTVYVFFYEMLLKCIPTTISLQSGVGKTSLISRIFGVEDVSALNDGQLHADVENELTSPLNDRFVWHNFEPHRDNNYDNVVPFVEEKERVTDINGQLHAVWLCFQIPIPTYGERLLDDAAKEFLEISKELLGNTPTIVVFTKHDRLVSYMRQRMPGDPEAAQRYLEEECVQPIRELTRENIAHVAVSSKPKYEQGLKDLMSLTQDMVSMSFTSAGNTVSAVSLALADAQRLLPTSKVQLSIEVGKQKYWSMLSASVNFPGHTILDCLRVIHIDIVAVWNFYDPCQYLNSEEFRKVMMNMVERVDAAAAEPNSLTRTDSFTEIPLIALAPVVLPFNVGKWVLATYQRLQDFPTKFMAYIVDLTHVLQILFSLITGMRAKKLTRTAIKMAYKAYLESEWMTHAHTDISYFRCSAKDRDDVLDKITSMTSAEDGEDRVSAALERMPSVDLERDEEWTSEEVSH